MRVRARPNSLLACVTLPLARLRLRGLRRAELGDEGVETSGAHADRRTFRSNVRGDEATLRARAAAAEAAGGGAAGDLAAEALCLHPPLPTLDASREWPDARHLHTVSELAAFREASASVQGGVVAPALVPPVSVVPGLGRGLEETALHATRHHTNHGGNGGEVTALAVASASAHKPKETAHGMARALSALPLLHYLDHEVRALKATGHGHHHHHHHRHHRGSFGRRGSKVSAAEAAADAAFTEQAAAAAAEAAEPVSPRPAVGDPRPGSSAGARPGTSPLSTAVAKNDAFLAASAAATAAEAAATEAKWVRRVRLEAERASLRARASGMLADFNGELATLRRERLILTADVAGAEVRLLTLWQELKVLQGFEAKDVGLAEKLKKCVVDKAETAAQTVDTRSQIRAKKEELVRCRAAEAEVTKDFFNAVNPQHPFHLPLLKIFRRKIKRAKKRPDEDGDEAEEESSEEEEEEDDGDAGDDDEGGGDAEAEADDSCPPGCDTGVYELVLVQRVKRLDQEDKLSELIKNIDEMEKALTRLEVKEKSTDKDLAATEAEIERFQSEKQRTLNALVVALPLKASQLCCFPAPEDKAEGPAVGRGGAGVGGHNALATTGSNADASTVRTTDNQTLGSSAPDLTEPGSPTTPYHLTNRSAPVVLPPLPSAMEAHAGLGTHCVFPFGGLGQLRRRVGELKEEGADEQANLADLHKTKKALERKKVAAAAAIAAQEAKNLGLQTLRFGQVLDMALVEKGDLGDERDAIHARELLEAEAAEDRRHARLLLKVKALKESLFSVTGENTELLSAIATLSGRQFQLEKELNTGGGGGGGAADGPALRREVEERNKLVRANGTTEQQGDMKHAKKKANGEIRERNEKSCELRITRMRLFLTRLKNSCSCFVPRLAM